MVEPEAKSPAIPSVLVKFCNLDSNRYLFVSDSQRSGTSEKYVVAKEGMNEERNIFELQGVVERPSFYIYNPTAKKYICLSSNTYQNADREVRTCQDRKDATLFDILIDAENKYYIYNIEYDQMLYVSRERVGDDSIVWSHKQEYRAELRSKFTVEPVPHPEKLNFVKLRKLSGEDIRYNSMSSSYYKRNTQDDKPVEDNILWALNQNCADLKGTAWDYTSNNTLPQDWIMQTPTQDGILLNSIENMLKDATSFVDVLTLNNIDGEFLKKLQDAINSYEKQQKKITIRIFLGVSADTIPGQGVSWLKNVCFNYYISDANLGEKVKEMAAALSNETCLKYVTIIVGAGGNPLYFGAERSFLSFALWWNHAKILTVDGRDALVGGINFWGTVYLDLFDPVHDLSMRVKGPAAASAQNFIDQFWRSMISIGSFVRPPSGFKIGEAVGRFVELLKNMTEAKPYFAISANYQEMNLPKDALKKPPNYDPVGFVKTGNIKIFGVGRRGGQYWGTEPGEIALVELIHSAKKDIYFSQQGLYYPTDTALNRWDALTDAIVCALVRGVSIKILVSRVTDSEGYHSVDSSTIKDTILDLVLDTMGNHRHGMMSDSPFVLSDVLKLAVRHTVSEKISVRHLKNKKDGKYARNHAKVIIVDNQAAYIGSQNAYPTERAVAFEIVMGYARLDEYGYVIVDEAKVNDLLNQYWNPLWNATTD
ncbi:unnamed protein product [Adineta ricciae]|uniref:PLD phosphodiesterase domain-containing protein n=1 Tax=Adineta ricciae TaxID=249248 RepID=A0A815WFB1_ADIRI|nr:unnamed protein product [Adineta ricciae]CAF1635789.1 unnamed protein product [Adineta ricciae]